jgi:hypothetical protein
MIAITERNTADPPTASSNADLTVADAVWIGTALLHQQEHSEGPFSTETIAAFVENHHLTKGARKSIWQHVNQHCVANRKPNPNRACMLFAMGGGDRRLFRDTDRSHPERMGGRTHPDWEKLPKEYAHLRKWYETVWNTTSTLPEIDPLLVLAGKGRGMWNGQSPDEYVASLREGWEKFA